MDRPAPALAHLARQAAFECPLRAGDPGERSRRLDALEPAQHLVEQVVAAEVRAHAGRREHDHVRVAAGGRRDPADRRVDRRIDIDHRVAEPRGDLGVVHRMGGIAQVPGLVRDAVGLGERGEEEIPGLALQEVHGAVRALGDARHQLVAQQLVLRGRAPAGQVAFRDRVHAELPGQLCREVGRAGHEATSVHDVVYQPIDRLDAVQPLGHAGLRYIEQGDAPAGGADHLPDRRRVVARGIEGLDLIGRGIELLVEITSVLRRRHAGRDAGPERAAAEARQTRDDSPGALVAQRSEVRERAAVASFEQQTRGCGIEADQDRARSSGCQARSLLETGVVTVSGVARVKDWTRSAIRCATALQV